MDEMHNLNYLHAGQWLQNRPAATVDGTEKFVPTHDFVACCLFLAKAKQSHPSAVVHCSTCAVSDSLWIHHQSQSSITLISFLCPRFVPLSPANETGQSIKCCIFSTSLFMRSLVPLVLLLLLPPRPGWSAEAVALLAGFFCSGSIS